MPKDTRYEVLQKALIEARLTNELTQLGVANRLGKPQSFVSKYESGERRLDVIEFLDVCVALNTNPALILKKAGSE